MEEPQDEAKQKEQIITKDDPYIRLKIAEMYGKEKEQEKYDLEINRLLEYAREKGAETKEDILWEVRRLDSRLMTGGFSEDRIKNISNYLFLSKERDAVDNTLKKMEVEQVA